MRRRDRPRGSGLGGDDGVEGGGRGGGADTVGVVVLRGRGRGGGGGHAVLGIHVVVLGVVEQLVEGVRADDDLLVRLGAGRVGVAHVRVIDLGSRGLDGSGTGAHAVGPEQTALGGARHGGEGIHPAVRIARRVGGAPLHLLLAATQLPAAEEGRLGRPAVAVAGVVRVVGHVARLHRPRLRGRGYQGAVGHPDPADAPAAAPPPARPAPHGADARIGVG